MVVVEVTRSVMSVNKHFHYAYMCFNEVYFPHNFKFDIQVLSWGETLENVV